MLELKVCVSHSRKLSSFAHYPDSGWTCSKVRAVRQWPRFSFCQGPSFFLSCQHFHKFTLQAQVTRLEGNSGVLVVAYNAREQLADKGQS